MPRTPMKTRSLRAGDVWDDAMATADAAGEDLPDRIREYLEWYARRPGARAPRRPEHAVTAAQHEAFLKALLEAERAHDRHAS